MKQRNYVFYCDTCLLHNVKNKVSDLREQISCLTRTVQSLVKEFALFKSEKAEKCCSSTSSPHGTATIVHSESSTNINLENSNLNNVGSHPAPEIPSWATVAKTRPTIRIKGDGSAVNLKKINDMAVENCIQITKATVKEITGIYM